MVFKVVITGASGVLGSAIHKAFRQSQQQRFEILALSGSRSGIDLKPIDLLDTKVVENELTKFKPNWVIHCAAERRPDVAEKDPERARKLNVDVPAHLASLSRTLKFKLVYISTDYVFDGTSPPYTPSASTNPLQFYGQTKRDGELAVLGTAGADVIVFRVPVLYGPAPNNADSAINILLDIVQDQSGKIYKMDHFATRYPTNVVDIAQFLVQLTALKKPLPPIIHYSAAEPFTKYEMCLIFSKILGVPHGHIIAESDPPSGPGAVNRPGNCQLYTRETEELGVEGGLGLSLFEEWWTEQLKGQ